MKTKVTNIILRIPEDGQPFAVLNDKQHVEVAGFMEWNGENGRTIIATLVEIEQDEPEADPAAGTIGIVPSSALGRTLLSLPDQPPIPMRGSFACFTGKTSDELDHLAARAKELRVAAGHSQAQVAWALGWSASYIGSMEAGRTNVALAKRMTIAKAVIALYDDGGDMHAGITTPARPSGHFGEAFEKPIANPFGAALRTARKAAGDKTADVAKAVDSRANYISKTEQDPTRSKALARRMAALYGVPVPAGF